jgi:S1-C subfamily serine protease
MKSLIPCFFSAVLGGLFVTWFSAPEPQTSVVAQDRRQNRGPGFPLVPGQPLRDNAVGTAFNEEGVSTEETINIDVYKNVNKSVANITTKASRGDLFFLLEVPSEGSGSGSVIDKAGHILTNYHVIEGAHEVMVAMYDGKVYEATFVGADPVNDIAVIKIDAPKEVLFPVQFADSSKLQVGMKVFAIGNPFGLERTMTTGIISSLNRSLKIHGNRTIKSIIQIDAAINPGNSGGPLLDSQGRLIGINTAIASRTGQSSGVGFAIPINLAARVVPQLIAHGRVFRPDIGIAKVYETDEGLLIAKVTPRGPAEKAGLRGPKITRHRRGPFVIERADRSAADLIIEMDGEKVESADDFLGYIEGKKAHDRVVLTIIREGQRKLVSVTLGENENDVNGTR